MSDFSYNQLPDNTWQIVFSRLKNLTFYTQEFALPSISIPDSTMQVPGGTFKTSSGQLEVDDITFSFIVDENMKSYLEMYTWLKELSVNDNPNYKMEYSDIYVLPMSSNSSKVINTIVLKNCFPVRLGQLTFRTNSSDTTYITCDATFSVMDFEIKNES